MTHFVQLAAISALILLTSQPVTAKDRQFLTGGEAAETDYYTYVGVIVPGAGWKNGKGLFQRYWIDQFGYEYNGAPGRVEASTWGGEVALGYVTPNPRGWWSASVGLRYTDTSLSPDDPNASARGTQASAKIQLEIDQALATDWRIGAIGSYTLKQNQYWGRLRITRRVSPHWSLGCEGVVNGNDETDSIASGLVLIWHPPSSSWSLGLKAGYRQQDISDGGFAGIELGNSF